MKGVFKIIVIFILGIGGGIFADQILWPYFIERPLFYEYRLEQGPVYITERREIVIRENNAVTLTVEKAEKTVAGVRTKLVNGEILEGSGLVITSDGLMVTLASLVPQGSSFSFFVDGKQAAFQILKRDLEKNLALVKLTTQEGNLPTAGFADLAKMKLGEKVILIGTIFKGKDIEKTVNTGIVKNFSENSIETNIFEEDNLAGSPLFNIEGNVLGLNTIGLKGKVISIPASQIKQFVGL